MIVLIALHLAMAIVSPWLARWLGGRVFLAAALAPAATAAWAAWHARAVLAGSVVVETIRWAPDVGFELGLRVDAFSLVMIALVSGIGVLIFWYSAWYFREGPDNGRLAALLIGFAGAMLGLVVSDNLIAIYLFWELTSITSYLLIGFEDRSASARMAALRALLITAAGGLAMLGGFVLLAQYTGAYSLSEILAASPGGLIVEIALLLILFGAFTKSAQAPFHFWLPGAMAAPTPVSAYLHSATMVKAGVYLVARLAPVFAGVWFWRPLVIGIGLATMLNGGWRALAQRDLKLLLAHGTTSQLGLLMVLFGAGYEQATLAGVALIAAHGAFKATLFMVVGIVDHKTGTRDLTQLSGIYRSLPFTFLIAAIAAASMAGLPPLAGFVAKEAAFGAFAGIATDFWGRVVVVAIVTGSALTFGYSARFLWGGFGRKAQHEIDRDRVISDAAAPSPAFVAPAALLALATLLSGIYPGLVSDLLVSAAQALDVRTPSYPLALWHGFNQALALSAIAIASGVLLWRWRRRIAAFQDKVHLPLDGARIHDRSVSLFLHYADVLTGRLQTGSLPMYLVVILGTATLASGIFLLVNFGHTWPGFVAADRPMQLVVALLMIGATVNVTRSQRRIVAVISVSIVGYGVAFLFVIHGAPDLALTQLLVETLLLVLFVLVLRHFPPEFSAGGTPGWHRRRILLAASVGAFAMLAASVAVGSRSQPSISEEHLRRALPEADGRNVVNVTLVDFRAFDTFGEVIVLTAAALGVIGLVRAARRQRAQSSSARTAHRGYRRSPILDGASRMLFHTLLMVSLVLLTIGHNKPGGGFIGGLVAGAAFTVVYLAGGTSRVQRAEPASPELYLGSGITLAGLTGSTAWIQGGEFLEAVAFSAQLPLIGSIKVSSVFVFDVGVYLIVIGLVTALLTSIGREEAQIS